MKKIIVLLLSVLLVAGLFVGCAGTQTESDADSSVAEETSADDTADESQDDTTDDTTAADEDSEITIVMVAKMEGFAWFDAIREGVEEFGEEMGINAYQIAPEGGDSAQQVQMVQDLIAQDVDAILVIPNDAQSMVSVLDKAREEGIVVVTHEASDIADHVDYDMESFVNQQFGIYFAQELAEAMGGEGQYVTIVGGLGMTTHMQWNDAMVEYIEENYPDMELINAEPYEDNNDETTAYNKTIEILKAYPDLKGISSTGAASAGVAQALKEKGRDDVALVGGVSPSTSAEYIKEGWYAAGFTWNPKDAGYITAAIAYKILQGETIDESTSFDREGYEEITMDGNIIYGDAALISSPENVDSQAW